MDTHAAVAGGGGQVDTDWQLSPEATAEVQGEEEKSGMFITFSLLAFKKFRYWFQILSLHFYTE